MSKVTAGFIALLVPAVGIFISRAILGNFSQHIWLYLPIFWILPLSLVPAIMIWSGGLENKREKKTETPPAEGFDVNFDVHAGSGPGHPLRFHPPYTAYDIRDGEAIHHSTYHRLRYPTVDTGRCGCNSCCY